MKHARPLDIAYGTDKLRQLILENPTLPIVVLTDSEVINDSNGLWYGNCIDCSVEELIQLDNGKIIENDYAELEEYISDKECDEEWAQNLTDTEYNEAIQKMVKEYDPLWTKCICIYSTN